MKQVLVSEAALESIKRMAEQDAKDAARYRWLCNGNGYFLEEECLCGHENEKELADAAIDAAMQEQK